MKKVITITDLTRMQQGRVCIAGYDDAGRGVRPTLPPPGIPESQLYQGGRASIYPFARIEFDLLAPTPKPPHTEDWPFAAGTACPVGEVKDREAFLRGTLFPSVEAVFEQPIQHGPGWYVLDCQGPRSVGTICPLEISDFSYSPGENGAWDYRLHFADQAGCAFRLKVTDLTWHAYCDSLRGENADPERIAFRISARLRTRKVYLRIGLARGWKEYPERCYLQVNGIYTFPDLLEGKTFAVFRTRG